MKINHLNNKHYIDIRRKNDYPQCTKSDKTEVGNLYVMKRRFISVNLEYPNYSCGILMFKSWNELIIQIKLSHYFIQKKNI